MKRRHTAPRKSQSSRRKKGFSTKPPRSSPKKKIASPKPVKQVRVSARKPANPWAIQAYEPEPDAVYPIEAVSQITGVPRRSILIYCKHNLISPSADPAIWGYWFTADEIHTLRLIESVRHGCGDDQLAGIAMILDLMDEVQFLRAQLREAAG